MPQEKNTVATSRCGLDCYTCPAYIATVTNDYALRQKTNDEWNKKYNATGRVPITKEDINCLGCLSLTGPIYKHCHECGIRICAVEKHIQNCGSCKEYHTCPKIAALHKLIPEGKKVCDNIVKSKD